MRHRFSFDAKINKEDVICQCMFNLYKYENMLYMMTLSGKEIKDYLEMSYFMWTNRMKSPDDHLLWFKEKRREGAEDRALSKISASILIQHRELFIP